MKQYRYITDPALAQALAHPLRTRILGALESRTASPSELAEEFGVSVETLSYHVRRLSALGFLKLVKRVPRRGALEHYYTATAGPHITSGTWEATPKIVKQAIVAAALREIGARVEAAAAGDGFELAESHLSRTPARVDRQGFHEIASALDALVVRVREIGARSAARLASGSDEQAVDATAVFMLFTEHADQAAGTPRKSGNPAASRMAGKPGSAPKPSA